MDREKLILDAAAGSLTVATVIGWLPAVAAGLTIIYTALRIFESQTAQRLLRAVCARCAAWWDKP